MTIDNVIELDKILLEDSELTQKHDILTIPKNIKFVFLVEGKDDFIFYSSFFKQYFKNHTSETIQCGGKKAVLNRLTEKATLFHQTQIPLFFIDKDFDDYLEKKITDDALFITDGYSFENYLVTPEALSELLEYHWFISKNLDVYNDIIEKYKRAYQKFVDFIKPFMKWWIECQVNDNKIDCFSLEYEYNKKSLINIDNSFEVIFISSQEFETVFKAQSRTQNAIINQTINDLNNDEHYKWLHGKYALDFMLIFYKKLQHNIQKPKPHNKKENREALIEFLSPRISIPATLDAFLSRHIQLGK